MRVLSLFDGISCGRAALERTNISVDEYYASEIDPHAVKISNKNYPDIIQLGDIKNWRNWNIDFSKIDILLAGFPCQAWSVAGKQQGDKDPRGELVHHLIGIMKKIQRENPKLIFLFENVKMKKEFINYINELFGYEPILINSSLLSAQNRERLYWTNIPRITQPENKGILLKEILQSGLVDREKSYTLDASYYKGSQNRRLYLEKSRRQIVLTEEETILHNLYGGFKENFPRIFNDKSPTLRTSAGGGHIPSVFIKWLWEKENIMIKNRLLTPIECERLQTLPDNYTEGISNTQRYKCLGNGWTIDVISHILSFIHKEKE